MRMLLILSLLAACRPESAERSAEESREIEIEYGEAPFNIEFSFAQNQAYGDDPRQVLDLFFDEAATEPTPLIIYVHSGLFLRGNKEGLYAVREWGVFIQDLLDNGAAFATINYRLLSQEPVDTEGVKKSLADICYALQYLRYHHETFNIDPDRVAILGNSSGASAAMLLGTIDDMARPNSDDPIRRESTRISGFAALEPQASLDITRWSEDVFVDYNLDVPSAAVAFGFMPMLLSFHGMETVEDFYSDEITAYREDLDMLSFMSADDPPMFVHSDADELSVLTPGFDVFHHPHHAREAIAYGEAAGMDVVGYIRGLGVYDESRESLMDFLLRVVQ